MKHRQWMGASLIVGATILMVLPASAQDWKGRGRIQGRVTTESGEPIEGAKVTVYLDGDHSKGPEATTTNKKGRWSVGGLRRGHWSIRIEKDGFVPREGAEDVSELKAGRPTTVELRNLDDTEEAKKGREVRGWIDQAQTAFQQKKYAEARELYKKALPELKEDSHPSVYKAIAQTYLLEGDLTEAAKSLNQVFAATPDDPEALKLYASILGQQGQTDEAIATLKRLIEVNPEDTESIQLIANILVGEGREEEAQVYIDQLPEGKGVNPDAYLNLGVDEYNANNFTEALVYFNKAIAQDDQSATAYWYRALAYLATGDTEASKADFRKMIELDPDGPNAAQATEFLSSL